MVIKNINVENYHGIRMSDRYYFLKVCLFADQDVGKGTFSKISEFRSNSNHLSLGYEWFIQDVLIYRNKRVRFQFWSMGNERRFSSLWNFYIRGAFGIILNLGCLY